MKRIDFSDFTWIIAYEICGNDISRHFEALSTIAKQNKMIRVIVSKNSIIATDQDFNILVKNLIESIYLN